MTVTVRRDLTTEQRSRCQRLVGDEQRTPATVAMRGVRDVETDWWMVVSVTASMPENAAYRARQVEQRQAGAEGRVMNVETEHSSEALAGNGSSRVSRG